MLLKDMSQSEKEEFVSGWFNNSNVYFMVTNMKTNKVIKKDKWESVYPKFLINEDNSDVCHISFKKYCIYISELELVFYTDKITYMFEAIIEKIQAKEFDINKISDYSWNVLRDFIESAEETCINAFTHIETLRSYIIKNYKDK